MHSKSETKQHPGLAMLLFECGAYENHSFLLDSSAIDTICCYRSVMLTSTTPNKCYMHEYGKKKIMIVAPLFEVQAGIFCFE